MMSKKLICVALICTWCLAAGAWADLVGHWKLDEGSGNVAADSSGNGGDGMLQGDPLWVAGMLDGALEMDGDDSVDCGDILPITDALTIACWVNPAGLTGDNSWVARSGAYVFKSGGASLKFTTPGILDHTAGNTTLEIGTWQHVAVTFAPGQAGGAVFYLNGVEAQRLDASAMNVGYAPFLIGNNQWGQFYEGQIDDVRVYDHILGEAQMAVAMAGEIYPFAAVPKPSEGEMVADTKATLGWVRGEIAVSHNVYLGTDREAVANATPDDANLFLGSTTETSMSVEALTPGQTYYWRVDAVNDAEPDSPWKGEVWSFWVQPDIAWEPVPADGTPYIFLDQVLSWTEGLGTLFHTVYFGESFDEVNDTTVYTTMTPDAFFDPAPLEIGKTYYWRIDEYTSPLQTNKGDVWSFTTLPQIEVSEPNLLAWWTLDEGVGTNVLDWSGHGHHGTLRGDTRWQEGYFDSALYFDGSGDYVDLGTPADLHLTQNYTYTAWFKVGQNINGDSGPQYLLCIGSRSDLVFGVEDGVGVDGDLSLHYYDTEPGFHAVGVGKTDWRADEWHMVAGTRDEEGHKIYLDGELRNSDTNVNADNFGGALTRMISLGGRAWTGHQFYHGLIDEVRIYNRALSAEEIQVLMRGDPLLAWNPDPQRGALVDIRDATALRWQAGDMAASHDVYLGQDKDAVAAAGIDAPQYQGNQPGTSFPLAGLVEFGGGDYYWRIDEVQADGTVHKGRIWKFSIPPYLIVDNFESYTNFSPDRVFQTWVDGLGFSGDEFFPDGDPGNGTGALVGHDIWSLDSPHYGKTIVETGNVHGGGQAMPLYYDNISAPYRSEAVRTWTTPQDWTVEAVTDLTLFVRGEAANAPDPLYIVIEDSGGRSGVATNPDAAILTIAEWTPWNIPLGNFADAGVTLTAVKKMVLGVGSRDGSTPGGTGVVYFDDIWLTRDEAE